VVFPAEGDAVPPHLPLPPLPPPPVAPEGDDVEAEGDVVEHGVGRSGEPWMAWQIGEYGRIVYNAGGGSLGAHCDGCGHGKLEPIKFAVVNL
jgi:hypothetical protein